jgi:hypothetical protein
VATRDRIGPKVIHYITERPGQVVWCTEIAEATELTERQCSNAIYHARRGNETLAEEIQVIVIGNAWRYVPFRGEPPTTTTAIANATAPTVATNARPIDAQPAAERKTRRRAKESKNGDAARLFQEVGPAGDDVIIQDENGVLYRASRLT